MRALVFLLLVGCAHTDDAPATNYAAERMLCVHMNDAAAPARECMRAVDRRYGQDGGLN